MKCKFKKENKDVCKNNALQNEKFCYWHSKKIPENEKKQARSRGGKKKTIQITSDYEYYELNNISDVIKLNAELINGVLQKNTDLKILTSICYSLNLQMKLLELNKIETKISNMENLIVKVKLPEGFE